MVRLCVHRALLAWLALAAIAGCYAPEFSEGLGCTDDGFCPSGQTCSPQRICVTSSPAIDASTTDSAIEEPIDATTTDADPCADFVAGSQTFDYTGAIAMFTVPDCATLITIEAFGAQGGDVDTAQTGGLGARMKGEFTLSSGDVLHVLVGGQGVAGTGTADNGGGTGGGGSFVVQDGTTPLVIAGGGGGATGYGVGQTGGDGQLGGDGQSGVGTLPGSGGTAGAGGTPGTVTSWHSGTGGGGFSGDGVGNSTGSGTFGTVNGPGLSFLNGGAGGLAGTQGRSGGFGGGGASGFTGGGGGGYSGGGGGGWSTSALTHGGGGGGSYNAGSNQDNAAGVRSGAGEVIISWQ